MGPFRTPVDIANKCLSVLRQPAIYSFQDNTVQAIECGRVYDSLRLAELRRSCWRFSTRRVVLRALTNTTMYLDPPAWIVTTNYNVGDVVVYNNQDWVCLIGNVGNQPGNVPSGGNLFWDSYFGPVTLDVWNGPVTPLSTTMIGNLYPGSYWTGELVYITPNDGTFTIYRSLVSNNSNNPQGVDQWMDATVYLSGQVVQFNSINYQSRINLNFNNEPDISPTQWTTTITSPLVSNTWTPMTTSTMSPLDIEYPLGAGPTEELCTRNAYHLPAGFLRQAPADPRAGINPALGGPSGNLATDWTFESDFIVSQNFNPIMLRFVADMQSVPEFDALFAEALSTRMGIELAPRLADTEHLAIIVSTSREEYARTISEARTINGIETQPVDPVQDDFISCRI